ncbi:MAG: phosphoglycerate mutase family protein [Chitinophagaceae bacterium]
MRICLLTVLIACIMSACSSQRYFVVRHAEKATVARNTPGMSATDPPLTDSGRQRAQDLRTTLVGEKIRFVFSTNTIRTKETAEPTRAHFGLSTDMYAPVPTDEFISQLKNLKGNTLIVGHSNTVDDVVNKLMGQTLLTDLPETEYNHLFLVIKKGKKWKFRSLTYGK